MSFARPAGPSPSAGPSSPAGGEDPATTRCPGCGSVLLPLPGPGRARPGASAACTRLFEETVRGLRDEAGADPAAAATLALAEAAYTAQHPADGVPAARADLVARAGGDPVPDGAPRPRVWTTTVADVAADLDVIDLSVLVDAWARAVVDDWRHAPSG